MPTAVDLPLTCHCIPAPFPLCPSPCACHRADYFIVSPILELVKAALFFLFKVSGSMTVLTYVLNNVSIPPRPRTCLSSLLLLLLLLLLSPSRAPHLWEGLGMTASHAMVPFLCAHSSSVPQHNRH